MTVPDFIEIDAAKDKQDLIAKYEELTDTKLYPVQDAMIIINLIAYYGSLAKTQMNEAAKLNLVESSHAPFLDFLGRYKNCYRVKASEGYDRLRINLNTTFSYDVTITKGFQVKTNDAEYIFETTEDLTIPAGDSTGIVEIKSQECTKDVNKYQAGEITTVISSAYSYIESVTNLDGVTGGSEDEDDESYIQRILLAPESFTVAGPELAYKYFTQSAHSAIIDSATETPEEDITVQIDDVVTTVKGNEIYTDNAVITGNFEDEEVTINLTQSLPVGTQIKVRIPHPYKIYNYILAEESAEGSSILEAVEETLKPVRPLCDYVINQFAQRVDYTISGTVYLYPDANEDNTKTTVNEALNNYINGVKNKLNTAVVLSHIITAVKNIDGVYDFKPDIPAEELPEAKNIAYTGTIGTLNYIRKDL